MASVLPSCNTSDVMAQLANVTSPTDDVYDHEGAMEFIVATLLVYCLIGIAGLLVMKIRRRASMGQRTVTMREEHIQSYIKQADDLRLAGYRDKLKIEAKRMMYYIESIERRKSEAGSVMEVTTFLEDSSTQTSPLTIAEEPSFTIAEEPSFTIAEEPSFTIAEEPSFTIAEEPSFTIAEEPSFTIAEEPSFNLPTQQFLTYAGSNTLPPNIGRDVRSCGFKTHLSSSALLTTYEVPDISTNNLTNNVPAHVTNVPAHVTNVPTHVTNVPANVTNVPAHVTNNVPAHVTHVPAHVTNVPAHVTNVPAHVTNVPAHVTNVPAHVTNNVPANVTNNVPAHVTNVPAHVTNNVPAHVTNVPAHVTNVPAHVTNVPAHVTNNVPAHVTHVPAHVTNVPAHVTNVPAHVTNVPAHVTNVPAHVTNNLTTERPATQEDMCVQEDIEDNNDEHMSLI
ncbi:uncharacterized protein LOC131937945 [Physella acuta]|uniref:uncharacterized protein LOC131937945 n=1 Tax=Physella acuta TaxID=109671 RepID=UPI0027DE01B7|nr:uncharacterized protein LOC131937945 [Physella acuta]